MSVLKDWLKNCVVDKYGHITEHAFFDEQWDGTDLKIPPEVAEYVKNCQCPDCLKKKNFESNTDEGEKSFKLLYPHRGGAVDKLPVPNCRCWRCCRCCHGLDCTCWNCNPERKEDIFHTDSEDLTPSFSSYFGVLDSNKNVILNGDTYLHPKNYENALQNFITLKTENAENGAAIKPIDLNSEQLRRDDFIGKVDKHGNIFVDGQIYYCPSFVRTQFERFSLDPNRQDDLTYFAFSSSSSLSENSDQNLNRKKKYSVLVKNRTLRFYMRKGFNISKLSI